MPEAQPALSEEKTIPIEDTGNPVAVEINETSTEQEIEAKEEPQGESEHEEYSSGVKKRINDLTKNGVKKNVKKKQLYNLQKVLKRKMKHYKNNLQV